MLVIVSGSPGAGKSTLAANVAEQLGLPLFAKDEFKEALADAIGAPPDVEASQRLGLGAYALLHLAARRVLEAGGGLVLESNFRRGISETELTGLVRLTEARLIHCAPPDALVVKRYTGRAREGTRHPAHLDLARTPALHEDLAAGRFAPLDLGLPTLVVDTSAGYDPPLAAILRFAAGQDGR